MWGSFYLIRKQFNIPVSYNLTPLLGETVIQSCYSDKGEK